jgi:hypothetical protein
MGCASSTPVLVVPPAEVAASESKKNVRRPLGITVETHLEAPGATVPHSASAPRPAPAAEHLA